MSTAVSRNAAVFACIAGAFWPVWRWYVRRMSDGSDEPCGLVALAAAVAFIARGGDFGGGRGLQPVMRTGMSALPSRWCLFWLVGYIVTFPFVTQLMHGVFAVGVVGSLLPRMPGVAGMRGLLLLSLPVVATMQFYLGYPLRVLAAGASAQCLRLAGMAAERQGTILRVGGESILVDAPCSGVRMLWGGLFLACLVATHYRLPFSRALLSGGIALVVIVGANMLRSAALCLKEARGIALPEWTHAGIGLAIFAFVATAILAVGKKLRPTPCAA